MVKVLYLIGTARSASRPMPRRRDSSSTPRFPAASLEAPPTSFLKKPNMFEMSVGMTVTSCPRLSCSDVRHLALTLKEKRFLPAGETPACTLHWGAAKTVE